MMAQYFALKAEAADCLLFYRMGDFFELFFDDAKVAAACLDIALTTRGEHHGAPIPMCGVPVHAADAYLARLIKAGHRVAIAEQTESPAEAKKRAGKTLVSRAIVRVVTAGTLTEEALLDARAANWCVAIGEVGGAVAIAAAIHADYRPRRQARHFRCRNSDSVSQREQQFSDPTAATSRQSRCAAETVGAPERNDQLPIA
ncbi:MAG: DNA mismatch repair protein MutS, partial [Pseudomonadota bacterium]